MGAYSEIDIDLKYGDGTEQPVEAFSLGPEEKELGQEQIRFEDEDAQRAEADAAPQELKKLMGEEKPPEQDTAPAVPSVTDEAEAEARRAHEEAEAKRKAEWEAQREARKAAEEKQLQKVAAMGEEELLMASAKRINAETERLTRRNMKEYLAEYLQTLCLDDLEFARLTMHPRKSFMHCIWYINRKAREYLEQEMTDNGMQRPYGVNGMYGGDVPDDVVYQKERSGTPPRRKRKSQRRKKRLLRSWRPKLRKKSKSRLAHFCKIWKRQAEGGKYARLQRISSGSDLSGLSVLYGTECDGKGKLPGKRISLCCQPV